MARRLGFTICATPLQSLPPVDGPSQSPSSPPLASPSPDGAVLELTGTAPRVVFGSLAAPVCELRVDSAAGRLVSTCAIASADGRRLAADDEDLDAAGGQRQVREELTELKLEIAELRQRLAELLP